MDERGGLGGSPWAALVWCCCFARGVAESGVEREGKGEGNLSIYEGYSVVCVEHQSIHGGSDLYRQAGG